MLEIELQNRLNSLDSSDPKRNELIEKIAIIKEIRERIKPINAERFATDKRARANCSYVAEICARVLAGVGEVELAPLRKKNLTITTRQNEEDQIVYHEVISKEQASLVTFQNFVETINLLDDEESTAEIDLTTSSSRGIAKYIQSSIDSIILDLHSLPGSNISEGKDKTLTGLIYYYYEGNQAGHLANFFRTKEDYLFFVDAQNEDISETPPQNVLDYTINKHSIFYFVVKPSSGYYVKMEKDVTVKQEAIDRAVTSTTHTTSSSFQILPGQITPQTQIPELTFNEEKLIREKIQAALDGRPKLGNGSNAYKGDSTIRIVPIDIPPERFLEFLHKYIYVKSNRNVSIIDDCIIIQNSAIQALRENIGRIEPSKCSAFPPQEVTAILEYLKIGLEEKSHLSDAELKYEGVQILLPTNNISGDKILKFLTQYIYGRKSPSVSSTPDGFVIEGGGITTLRKRFGEYKNKNMNGESVVNSQIFWNEGHNSSSQLRVDAQTDDETEDEREDMTHQSKRTKIGVQASISSSSRNCN